MKILISSALLLASAASYGALAPAVSDPGRLSDYTNWFAPQFNVASDANFQGIAYPRFGVPSATAMDTVNRDWSGWMPNWGSTGLGGPIVGHAGMVVETLFLGETAGWWDDWGYRLNGVDYLLADGIQAKGGRTRTFGDYTYFTLSEGDTLDFFITGSGIKRQDGAITVGRLGGQFFVFDKSLNTGGAMQQSYYGMLDPLTSGRGPEFLGNEDGTTPFTVATFEDVSLLTGRSDRDFNDLMFAFRTFESTPCCGPVPEPSTYGVLAAAALTGLVAWRRRRVPGMAARA